jgi:hypothetical protein
MLPPVRGIWAKKRILAACADLLSLGDSIQWANKIANGGLNLAPCIRPAVSLDVDREKPENISGVPMLPHVKIVSKYLQKNQ